MQGQDANDTDSRKVEKIIIGLCKERENRLRYNFHQSKWKTAESKLHMGSDERAM